MLWRRGLGRRCGPRKFQGWYNRRRQAAAPHCRARPERHRERRIRADRSRVRASSEL